MIGTSLWRDPTERMHLVADCPEGPGEARMHQVAMGDRKFSSMPSALVCQCAHEAWQQVKERLKQRGT